ncbi:hypothetical protein V6N11_047716 [Hibiscus sabdariffa]
MPDLIDHKGEKVLTEIGFTTQFVSMGHQVCGGLELWNYPAWLRDLVLHDADGKNKPDHVDLAALEIYRDRERKVARYNQFRRALLLIPISKWEDLTQDKDVIEVLKEVYGDEVEELDIMVGLMVEEKIKGFATSKTTFFIFQLMASRRLEAERFFTSECNEETYTKKGLEWVNTTESLKDVLDCHCPEIPKKWINSTSAFSVWDSPKFNVVSAKVVMVKTSVKKEPKIMKGNGARHNLLKSCKVQREIENVIIIDSPKSVREDLQGIMQGSSGSRRGKLFLVINIDHDEYVKMDDPEFCVECGGDFNCDASSRKSCFVYDFQRKYTGLNDDDCWFIKEKNLKHSFLMLKLIYLEERFMKGPHSGDSNQEFSQALFGMMLANPTLLYMLLLEMVTAMGSPIWWKVKNVLLAMLL